MIKKVALGTLAIATVGTFLFGRDAISYTQTGLSCVRDSVRTEVPLEFEIKRAQQEVANLIPEVRKSLHLIATEEVEVASLQESIALKSDKLADQEEAILALSDDLKNGDTHYVYAGQNYSHREVQKDLADRFNRFKVAEQTLARERELLRTKEDALQMHRETLENMLAQKKNLEVELEQLEARMQTIDARKQLNSIVVDDSQLSRVETMISNIKKRLDVEDAVLSAEGDFQGLIPVEREIEENEDDITTQIEEYFHTQPGVALN